MPHQAAKELIDDEIKKLKWQAEVYPSTIEISKNQIAGLKRAKQVLDQSYKKPKGKRGKLI